VHGTGVYSAGVGPKGPALERFSDKKKKKRKKKKKKKKCLLFVRFEYKVPLKGLSSGK
jgi:hypothetical protein